MPRPDPSKRTPLWLQRLRAKDLLQVVRKMPDFPIVVETYRECLVDDLDLPRLRAFLDAIQAGSIRVVARDGEVASPFASDLVFRFTQSFLYQWDEPARDPPGRATRSTTPLLDALARTRGDRPGRGAAPGRRPPAPDRRRDGRDPPALGDLTPPSWPGRWPASSPSWPPAAGPSDRAGRDRRAERWVRDEDRPLYAAAFPAGPAKKRKRRHRRRRRPAGRGGRVVVRRYLRTTPWSASTTCSAATRSAAALATDLLERFADEGGLVRLDPVEGTDAPRWADRGNLDEVRRLSIAIRRRESVAVAPEVFADFVAQAPARPPGDPPRGGAAVGLALEQLQGFAAPAELWESEILPRRVRDFRPAWLDEALGAGDWTWRAEADGRRRPPRRVRPPRLRRPLAAARRGRPRADRQPKRRSSTTSPAAGPASRRDRPETGLGPTAAGRRWTACSAGAWRPTTASTRSGPAGRRSPRPWSPAGDRAGGRPSVRAAPPELRPDERPSRPRGGGRRSRRGPGGRRPEATTWPGRRSCWSATAS